MFETVLVADRGVAALRVVRTCQRLGVQAVAVHGDEDARSPHVRQADEAVPLGGSAFGDTYGDGRKIVEAARRTGAQAVHPGAGALALDPQFAREIEEAGLAWLGPPPGLLDRGTPPPAPGDRVVTVLLRDDGGAVQVLGRRERLGSWLDEEPAPGLDPGSAARLSDAAAGWARVDGPAGVVAVDVALRSGSAAVLGVVPLSAPGGAVTAAVSGVDPVELQLRARAADGEPARQGQRVGAAVALQLRAAEHFAGRLRRFRMPEGAGVATESAVAEGERVSAHRSRLLAVVTAAGRDRAEALARARASLDAFEVTGVPTNLPGLRALLADPGFAEGRPDPALLERIRRP